MDKDSCAIYRKMGFTHFVTILNPDPRQPNGFKAVKEGDEPNIFVDENGVTYPKADELPF